MGASGFNQACLARLKRTVMLAGGEDKPPAHAGLNLQLVVLMFTHSLPSGVRPTAHMQVRQSYRRCARPQSWQLSQRLQHAAVGAMCRGCIVEKGLADFCQ